jgi:hypothetical protein
MDLRKRHLGLVNLALDDLSGCQQGWAGKVFSGSKRAGSMSMPAMLGALGMKLVAVADDEWLPANTCRYLGMARPNLMWSRPPKLLPSLDRVFVPVPGLDQWPPGPLLLPYTPLLAA